MAGTKRSVWEIRFKALKQTISNEMEWIRYRVSNKTLEGTITDEQISEEKTKKEAFDFIMKRANELETTQPGRIYIIE